MLDSIRRGQRWLVGIVVAVVGGVFVFFMGWGAPQFGGGTTTSAVVELGDRRFELADFERARAERESEYQRLLGDQFDSGQAEDFLREQALGTLVDRAVLAREAEALGLRVTDEELRDVLRDAPVFQDEAGRFSVERYRNWVAYEYGREQEFKRDWRSRLLASKAVALLQSNVSVSEAEARMAALHELEKARIAYVLLDRAALPPDRTLSDEEVRAWLAENEDQVRLAYDANRDRFEVPEQVRIRHIATRPPADRQDDSEARADARARAEDALRRIREGASFADVALEVSDAPKTAQEGGDLGWVARGETAPVIEEAAFSLGVGETSEVLEGEGGFHVVRVEDRREAGASGYDEVKLELARELAEEDLAESRARELADRLSAAVREGASLEEAARALGLTLGRTPPFARRPDGYLPGVGGAPEAMAAAFALEPGESSPRIFEVGPKLLLVQTLEAEEPKPEELAQATAEKREQLESAKRQSELQDWINARRTQLAEAGELRLNREIIQ